MKTILTILTVALILSLIGNWLQYDSAAEEQINRSNERERFIKSEEHLKQQNEALDDLRKAERRLRWASDSLYALEKSGRTSDLKAMKARERKSRPANAPNFTLVDSVYAKADTMLLNAEAQRKADSVQFENEIRILEQRSLKLDSANTSKFELIQTLYHDSEKRVAKEVKTAKWLKRALLVSGLIIICQAVID